MNSELVTLKENRNVEIWSKQVEECRNSGLSVRSWCQKNNIAVNTYMYRQAKVWDSLRIKKPEFVEVAVRGCVNLGKTAVSLSFKGIAVDIHNGADENTILSVIKAIRNA